MTLVISVTCPECIKRAAGFILKAGQSKDCMHWVDESRNYSILARETKVKLTEKTWKQSIGSNGQKAIWKSSHKLKLSDRMAYWGSDERITHICISNSDHKRAEMINLCDAPSCFRISGIGWAEHVRQDEKIIKLRDAKEYYEKYEKARKEGSAKEQTAYCEQLAAAFNAFDIKASVRYGLMKKHASGITFSAKEAAKLLNALHEGLATKPITAEMPVWSVQYGDGDKEPLLLGARTKAAVCAHMIEHYCDERVEDGPNVPLDPSKLRIKPAQKPDYTPEQEEK